MLLIHETVYMPVEVSSSVRIPSLGAVSEACGLMGLYHGGRLNLTSVAACLLNTQQQIMKEIGVLISLMYLISAEQTPSFSNFSSNRTSFQIHL